MCFPEREIVARTAEFSNDIDECVDRKRVMLTAHGEDGIAAFATLVAVFHEGCLFQDLPCVREKFVALVSDRDAFIGAVKDGNSHFFFEFVDSRCKARLRYEYPLGSFGNVACVGDSDGVFKLLQSHSLSL